MNDAHAKLPPSDSTRTDQAPTSSSSVAAQNRRWLVGTVLVGLTAAGAGVWLAPPTAAVAQPAAQPLAMPVPVATVESRPVSTWDEFSGRLEAVERVDVRPRVAGTVQAVHFREGMLVKPGDLLITLDPAPYAAEVERAEADVAAAEARLAYATSERTRAERLWSDRAIAQREYDERDQAFRQAEASLRAARASLSSARLNLGYTQVRAPVAGRVGRLEITVGNLVVAGAGAPVLTRLVSVSPIYASFEADERVVTHALRKLGADAPGARGRIDRIPVQMGTADSEGTPFQGRLQLVDNQVDAKSGTVRVRAVFDNADGRLMPGQYARLRMGQAQAEPALLIHERAVGTDQNKKYVMVVDVENKAVYREVVLGPSVDGLRVVTNGLKAGERIVVNGLQRVRPGALLAPQPAPMNAQADPARRVAATQS